jgi:hypothetical protein
MAGRGFPRGEKHPLVYGEVCPIIKEDIPHFSFLVNKS